MKHKKLFISLTAVAAAIVFFGIFFLMWFVGDTYKDFEKFNKEFAIAGLDEGAIPQGLGSYDSDYIAGEDENGKPVKKTQQYFLQSAYMKDGSPSRIYVTGKDTGYVGYVTLLNEDGTPHFGHVGGIATNGDRLWVGYNDSVLVAEGDKEYSQSNILAQIIDKAQKNNDLPDGEKYTVKFTASFKANCNASFLFYFDDTRYTKSYDRLYVGEFYRKGNYETEKTHHVTTPAGYKNTAFMYEYNVDNANTKNPYGLTRLVSNSVDDKTITEENNVPKIQKIFSLPEKIQGIAFSGRENYSSTSGILVLSQSYGLANSHLLCFDWGKVIESSNRIQYTKLYDYSFTYKDVYRSVGDKQTPYSDGGLYVYYIDMSNKDMFINDYSVPSMSEGMCIISKATSTEKASERVFVLFESGSKKYNMFTRESIKNVYSFIPKVGINK